MFMSTQNDPTLNRSSLPQYAANVFLSVAQKEYSNLGALTLEEKQEIVLDLGKRLNRVAQAHLGKTSSVDTLPADILGSDGEDVHETVLKFPFLDADQDGVPEEASCNLELWHDDTAILLNGSGKNQYFAAMPWPVSIRTDHETIKIDMRSAEASVMVFMHDETASDLARYKTLAASIDQDIIYFLRSALVAIDPTFTFDDLDDHSNSAISIQEEDAIVRHGIHHEGDGMLEYGTPSISFDAGSLQVDEVVRALIKAFNTYRTPSLSQTNERQNDLAILPTLFSAFVQGDKQPLLDALDQAMGAWLEGATFQKWKSVKDFAPGNIHGNLREVSICQPFYATTMLNLTGTYHQTTMPCRVLVWEENNTIVIAMSNPEMFLPAFFKDGVAQLPDTLRELFPIFATFVHNEIIAMINDALRNFLHVNAAFEYYTLGSIKT
jgi:hypothetical protein